MSWRLTLTAAALSMCTYATACGGAGGNPGSAADTSSGAAVTSAAPTTSASGAKHKQFELDSDGDEDNPGTSYYDGDDPEVLDYGREASPADRRRVTLLVRRYYAVAAAGDGAAGCRLTYSPVAESIAEDGGAIAGGRAAGGASCATAMSGLFEQDRAQLAAGRRLRLTAVRVSGARAYALLAAVARPERYLILHREAGAWRVLSPVDQRMP